MLKYFFVVGKINFCCGESFFSLKIKSNIPSEIDKSVSDELDEIKKRISKLEKS